MAYFNNPRTEEELKDQFRKLLAKYDYRDPKNEKLISAIRKEYDEKLLEIKRANGYQTTFEKVSNTIEKKLDEVKKANEAEKARIERLKNHRYTKEEYVKLYNNVKLNLSNLIQALVIENKCTKNIINRLNELDNVGFYQWFNAQRFFIAVSDDELMEKYNSSREILEYAIQSISKQTKTKYEKNLEIMEEAMGKYFREYYQACCDKYLDPIEIAEYEVQAQKDMKLANLLAGSSCYTLPWIFISLIVMFIFSFIFGNLADRYSTFFVICTMGISALLSIPVGNKLRKKSKRFSYATMGAKKQRARVTQRQKYEKERSITGLFRIILRFLGL
ncbi:MAG: hypothetical protein J6C64_13640 [Lachnospiraceae bacterium]|nr:hypothetical protein [Lachnospiraceae bacterium]